MRNLVGVTIFRMLKTAHVYAMLIYNTLAVNLHSYICICIHIMID